MTEKTFTKCPRCDFALTSEDINSGICINCRLKVSEFSNPDSNQPLTGKPIIEIDGGVTEIVTLYKNKIVISPRKALLGKLEGGTSEIIFIKSITDIEYKLGGSVANGFVQFRTPSSGNIKKGGPLSVMETTNDPNTFHFSKKNNDSVIGLLKKLEDIMSQQ